MAEIVRQFGLLLVHKLLAVGTERGERAEGPPRRRAAGLPTDNQGCLQPLLRVSISHGAAPPHTLSYSTGRGKFQSDGGGRDKFQSDGGGRDKSGAAVAKERRAQLVAKQDTWPFVAREFYTTLHDTGLSPRTAPACLLARHQPVPSHDANRSPRTTQERHVRLG